MDETLPANRDRRLLSVDASSQRSLESLSLGVGAVAFIVSAIVALLIFQLRGAPIAGPGSLGEYAAISGAVVAFVAFIAGHYVVRTPGRPLTVLDIADVLALALAHAVIALLTWTLLAVIMERGFIDAVVFGLSTIVLAGSTAAITGYLAFWSATHMDLSLLATVLAVFLVEGIVSSMLTSSDPHWWKMNLSALGMTDDFSAMAFNLTLIVAGLIVTTLARYATASIPSSFPNGAARARTCLIVVGVFLALVGVFPVDRFFALHTGVASGMVVAFGILVLRLKVWIPGMPAAFIALGWLFLAITLVLAVLFAVGFYTLTAVELVAGILIFVWIILFIRNAAALQDDTAAG